jgi:hypothetical protein
VGFNPFRPGRGPRPADLAMLVAAFVIVVALVAWATLG